MNVEAVLDLLRALVLVFILLSAFRFIGHEKFTARIVFFTLAAACILLCDLYWLAYDILLPDVRMPFAANEIGECALFLLLGAVLNSGKPLRFREAKREMLCAAWFSAANTALWIAWSGEWVQDILTGLAFAYFLCALVSQIKAEELHSVSRLRVLGILCVFPILGQTAAFFVPGSIQRALYLLCYIFLFAVLLYLLVKAIRAVRKDVDPTRGVYDTFTAFAWVVVTMYMSEGVFHAAAYGLSAICFPLMFLALKKEVEAL